MDEEGFPLLSVDPRIPRDLDATHREESPFPPMGLLVNQDQESGEATAQQVVVIRRPPPPPPPPPQVVVDHRREVQPSQDGSLRTDCKHCSQKECRRQAPHEHIHHHHQTFHMHMNFMCLCSAGHRGLRAPLRNVSECSGSLPPPQKTPQDTRTRREKSKGLFRVPSGSSQTSRSKKESAMTISIWKEMFLGLAVFDYGSMEWKEITKRFKYPFWLRKPFDTLTRYLPLGFLRLVQLLMFAFRLLLRNVCIIGLYSVSLYTHLRIHQICQERGIRPVFTGKVYHGPITYSVRAQCIYCKMQNQAKASLRYLQSLREESQHAPLR